MSISINIEENIINVLKEQLKEQLLKELKLNVIETAKDYKQTEKEEMKKLSIQEKRRIYQERWRQTKGKGYHKKYMQRPEIKQKTKENYTKKKKEKLENITESNNEIKEE
jgi:hypothetical protein